MHQCAIFLSSGTPCKRTVPNARVLVLGARGGIHEEFRELEPGLLTRVSKIWFG
jgi:hypothetical protein